MIPFFQTRSGGPYASTVASLGELPTIIPDIPICTVFIALYIGFAATNMTILQKNRRRNRKFILSGVIFGFCMARIVTLVLRIAWANRQHNVRLAIAAGIFVNMGILLIYIINFILAQRILRAKQPRIGWNPVYGTACKILYFSIVAALVMMITSIVISFYTLNLHTRAICRDIQLAALTYLLVFSCLPLLHILAVELLPSSTDEETFGEGSMVVKEIIVTVSTCLCVFAAGFKAGANWSPPRPITSPPWYVSKACFYVIVFAFEILILCLLTFGRIDKRFFIPNGCSRPGDYSRPRQTNDGSETDESVYLRRLKV